MTQYPSGQRAGAHPPTHNQSKQQHPCDRGGAPGELTRKEARQLKKHSNSSSSRAPPPPSAAGKKKSKKKKGTRRGGSSSEDDSDDSPADSFAQPSHQRALTDCPVKPGAAHALLLEQLPVEVISANLIQRSRLSSVDVIRCASASQLSR